jgi:hypothetical protein
MDVTHLLLFTPAASGSEFDVMQDPVSCLTFLNRIRQHIQKNRPSI